MKVDVPAVVGVPVIDEAEIDSPAGNDPDATDQTYGARPPVAASDWVKVLPVTPSANDDVATVKGARTSIVNDFVAVLLSESVTRTVNVEDPTAVGVPDTVAPDKDRPAGSEPDRTSHVYGDRPPVAVRV